MAFIQIKIYIYTDSTLSYSSTDHVWKSNLPNAEDAIDNFLEGFKLKSRLYVFKSNFTSPMSLPLHLFCGYQLVQSADLMQQYGHVNKIEFYICLQLST